MASTGEKSISLRVFEQELRAVGMWNEELITAWESQLATRTFSPAVKGLGELRVFGRSGDAPLLFPQVETLAVLDEAETVTDAERYILDITRTIVESSPSHNRSALAVVPTQGAEPPQSTRMLTFLPMTANIVIVTRVVGG
jgi:hypothetical protein